jgi:DNA repair exonuclease SbcCD nuclease subunit
MTIAICGDIHIRDTNPRARIDNYFEACMDKIDTVMSENDYMVCLGDFFDRPSMSVEYINKIVSRLSQYRNRILTIIGNHDTYYRTLNLDKTTLGLLDKLDIVKIMKDSFKLEDFTFDVASIVPLLKLPEQKADILLGHFFLDNSLSPKESLTINDLKNYGYVFLGHDHCPYSIVQSGKTKIYRNGSLTRVDAQSYNLSREYIIYTQLNKFGFVDKKIPLSNKTEIFDSGVLNKPPIVKSEVLYFSSLDNLIKDFKEGQQMDNMSTLKVLRELRTPEPCVEYLRAIHDVMGLYF